MTKAVVNRTIQDYGLGEFERFCGLCELWSDKTGCIYRFGPFCLFNLELIDSRLHVTEQEHLKYLKDKIKEVDIYGKK